MHCLCALGKDLAFHREWSIIYTLSLSPLLLLFQGCFFSRGVCVERATHPLHNNDGFCLHLPVFLLSASSAELQLIQRQRRRAQRGEPRLWDGEDDQVKNLPGLPAQLPPHLQLHPLPSTPGQPWWAHLKGEHMGLLDTHKCMLINPYTLNATVYRIGRIYPWHTNANILTLAW